MRRYLATGFVLDGDRFEYTGTGGELLKGFLKAIPLYLIAIIPFIAVSIMTTGKEGPENLWILPAYLPLIYFFPLAYYAARRYRLSRTTWRGIRFHLTGSAISYANFAMLRLLLNVISLGILTPYSVAFMHKYIVERMVFGNIQAGFNIKAINCKKLIWLNITAVALFIIYPLIAVFIAYLFGAQDLHGSPEIYGPELLKEAEKGKELPGFLLALSISIVVMLPIWVMIQMQYAAELLRGKINGMIIGDIRFKCTITAWDLFKFHSINALITIGTFGWGACFVIKRRMTFLTKYVRIGGDLNSQIIRQAAEQKAGIGEGIDDIFDFDTGFIGGGII